MNIKSLFHWTIILPILSAIFYFSGLLVHEGWFSAIGAMLLIGSVLSAVHHAEVVAHKVGEPKQISGKQELYEAIVNMYI